MVKLFDFKFYYIFFLSSQIVLYLGTYDACE